MLFCNLTPLDGRFVNAIVFCRKSEFCEYTTSLHIQHSIDVRQFEFFVFTMKQIASIFCNVSFAGQYTIHRYMDQLFTLWKQNIMFLTIPTKFQTRYVTLFEIFPVYTIFWDNPRFPDIYQTELQLNEAHTSDKETCFIDLNI